MRNHELETLLHKAVADALGVTLPNEADHQPKARRRLSMKLRDAPIITTSWRHQRVAEHA